MSGISISGPTPMWWMSSSADCARRLMIPLKGNSYTRSGASVMFLKRTESRSIATQLVLLFTLCAALLLSCGLGVFYWIVIRHAFEAHHAVLAHAPAAIRAALKQSTRT